MINKSSNRYINRAKKVWYVAFNKTFVYPLETHLHHQISFSQEGEDCMLSRIFEGQKKGFYVDVGAHHPQRFSNTYRFYLKGWRGINIDAMPGSMELFKQLRPEDINLESAISDSRQVLTYYMFNEPALNGFSADIAASRADSTRWQLLDKRPIKTQTLADVLDCHLPSGQEIDFLSIDVEGIDYQVLLSNNWQKYRPKIVLVEELKTSLSDLEAGSKVSTLMQKNGYGLLAKTFNTSFYQIKS